MPDATWDQISTLIGLGRDVTELTASQMMLRTILIYAGTLVAIRLGSKRFLSQASAFDVIVAIMLGSIMSRAINGSAPLLQTLLAGAVLIALHWLLAALAFRLEWFGPFVKGNRILLIRDGEVQEGGMKEAGITRKDLLQALRIENQESDPAKIRRAYLERNGDISAVPFRSSPRVLEVSVADGIQTVRIEVD